VYRRDSAVKRSIEYYKSREGKIKKRYLNGRRNEPVPQASPDETPVKSCETGVDATMVLHIQLTTSLIEGRAVTLKEVIGMVEKFLRQLSIGKSKKMFYIHGRSQTKPP
jgi:hypothetical protein